jgi:hypothetical protein
MKQYCGASNKRTETPVDIAAIKMATVEATTRATALEYADRSDPAVIVLETLFQTLRVLCSAEPDDGQGWLRVVLSLADLDRRLPLDALGATRLAQLRTRATTLLDVPAIESVEGLPDIHDYILAAINVGSHRYNHGDVRGCCTIYWATGRALLAARPTRGFPGHARTLAFLRQAHEGEPPALPLDDASVDAYAWTLRHAFDAALKVTG